jgi:hypothetical protein
MFCYLVKSYCCVLFKCEKFSRLIKSLMAMPNMPFFTGIGIKCNKCDAITSQIRGAQQEADVGQEAAAQQEAGFAG